MSYIPPVSEPAESVTYHGVPATRVRRAYTVTHYITGCAYCQAELDRGNTHFPSHFTRHGNHCTCDGCF